MVNNVRPGMSVVQAYGVAQGGGSQAALFHFVAVTSAISTQRTHVNKSQSRAASLSKISMESHPLSFHIMEFAPLNTKPILTETTI